MVFSDGVFYDPHDRLFKMWYMGGYSQNTCYRRLARRHHVGEARARRGRRARTSRMALHRDSTTVWLDLARARSGAALQDGALVRSRSAAVRASPDGIHWTRARAKRSGRRSHDVLLQPVPQRLGVQHARRGRPAVGTLSAAIWRRPISTTAPTGRRTSRSPGSRPTSHDPRRPEYNVPARALQPRLRRLREPHARPVHDFPRRADRAREAERHLRRLQPRRLSLGSSRPPRVPAGLRARRRLELGQRAIGRRRAAWSSATSCTSTSAAGAVCPARTTRACAAPASRRCGATGSRRWITRACCRACSGSMPSPGPGTLDRRDRSASRDAICSSTSTRPTASFASRCSTAKDAPIPRLHRGACVPVRGDAHAGPRDVDRRADLAALAGQTVRFRFHLTRGRLYAFWVSPSPNGASHGYVAAGGPGFTGPVDTLGDRPSC